jgi:hypothetical protein
MTEYVFVPLTDDMLYNHPELIRGPVRPYSHLARRSAGDARPTERAAPQRPQRVQEQDPATDGMPVERAGGVP